MADALPVVVWMSERDASCSYLNEQWLDLTGRTLEEELGRGWLDSVHPHDRAVCLQTYLAAFTARQSFSMEYRVRRHDGEYRWLLDTGMPRYGSDDVFHGYIGGRIDISDRREAETLLRDVNRRLIVAQENERRHIAGELHDHFSQQLALLALDLQQLLVTLPPEAEAPAETAQAAMRRTAEIASDVHAMSHRLHPSKLGALGLVATIRAHCRDVSRQSVAVQFTDFNVPPRLPADTDVCLFRVLEEALTNVVRHSGATEATVHLVGRDHQLALRVMDNGAGFAPHGGGLRGIGLISMQERVNALGGHFVISSAPGRGTLVEARLPCPAATSTSPVVRPAGARPRVIRRPRAESA
jgi:PAS domain S-box-containing protein